MKKGCLIWSLFVMVLLSSEGRSQEKGRGVYQEPLQQLLLAIEGQFHNAGSSYYVEHAEQERNKNPVSYLWPLCGIIQADNELEVLRAENNRVDRSMTLIQKYYDPAPPAPGYASYPPEKGGGDRFYDDNQWIGIALMDAWSRNKRKDYLEGGKLIYRFMMTAYDSASGAGLYWQEGKLNSKNTCSNGPGIILALQLFQATKEKPYLDTALLLYQWVNKYLRDPEGLYYDNIAIPSRKIDMRRYSYNTGTMLQSNLYLYEVTKDPKYLSEAKRIAESALSYFYGSGKLRDGFWFNAVLLRGYQHLLKHDADTKYLKQFATCIKAAISTERNSSGLFLNKGKTVDLTNQAGMVEILARLAYLEKKYQF